MGLLSGHLILIFGFNGQKTLGPFLAPSGAQEVSVRLANSALFLIFSDKICIVSTYVKEFQKSQHRLITN